MQHVSKSLRNADIVFQLNKVFDQISANKDPSSSLSQIPS